MFSIHYNKEKRPAVRTSELAAPSSSVSLQISAACTRIDVIDDAGRADHAMLVALAVQRMIVQERCTFRLPSLRPIERAGDRITPTGIVVALTLVAPPNGTVDRWTDGHGADLNNADDDGEWKRQRPRGGISFAGVTLPSIARIYPINASSVRPQNVRRTFFAPLRALFVVGHIAASSDKDHLCLRSTASMHFSFYQSGPDE
jgi:hypothetical protein